MHCVCAGGVNTVIDSAEAQRSVYDCLEMVQCAWKRPLTGS